MFNYCLVQLLDYEAQPRKKKKWLECKDCPVKGKCEKRKEKNDGKRVQ